MLPCFPLASFVLSALVWFRVRNSFQIESARKMNHTRIRIRFACTNQIQFERIRSVGHIKQYGRVRGSCGHVTLFLYVTSRRTSAARPLIVCQTDSVCKGRSDQFIPTQELITTTKQNNRASINSDALTFSFHPLSCLWSYMNVASIGALLQYEW